MWEAVNFQPWTQRKSRSIREFNRQNSFPLMKRYYSPSKGCAERQTFLKQLQSQFTNHARKGALWLDGLIVYARLLLGRKLSLFTAPFCKGLLALIQKSNPLSKDKDWTVGTSLVVQRLGLCTSSVGQLRSPMALAAKKPRKTCLLLWATEGLLDRVVNQRHNIRRYKIRAQCFHQQCKSSFIAPRAACFWKSNLWITKAENLIKRSKRKALTFWWLVISR